MGCAVMACALQVLCVRCRQRCGNIASPTYAQVPLCHMLCMYVCWVSVSPCVCWCRRWLQGWHITWLPGEQLSSEPWWLLLSWLWVLGREV